MKKEKSYTISVAVSSNCRIHVYMILSRTLGVCCQIVRVKCRRLVQLVIPRSLKPNQENRPERIYESKTGRLPMQTNSNRQRLNTTQQRLNRPHQLVRPQHHRQLMLQAKQPSHSKLRQRVRQQRRVDKRPSHLSKTRLSSFNNELNSTPKINNKLINISINPSNISSQPSMPTAICPTIIIIAILITINTSRPLPIVYSMIWLMLRMSTLNTIPIILTLLISILNTMALRASLSMNLLRPSMTARKIGTNIFHFYAELFFIYY